MTHQCFPSYSKIQLLMTLRLQSAKKKLSAHTEWSCVFDNELTVSVRNTLHVCWILTKALCSAEEQLCLEIWQQSYFRFSLRPGAGCACFTQHSQGGPSRWAETIMCPVAMNMSQYTKSLKKNCMVEIFYHFRKRDLLEQKRMTSLAAFFCFWKLNYSRIISNVSAFHIIKL